MASLFDQNRDQTLQRTRSGLRMSGRAPATTNTYATVLHGDSTPIFTKETMDIRPMDRITHAVVANDHLVLALANGVLMRRKLNRPDSAEEINYSKFIQSSSKLSSMFLDPLGQHLLLTFVPRNRNEGTPELFYLQRSSTKLRPVTKSRSYEVTEVGWNHENSSASYTGAILLGTSQGHILETEFSHEKDRMYQTGWAHVFDIGKGSETPITGIEFHRVDNKNKYVIIITTPKRLYSFIGYTDPDERPFLQPVFITYLNVPETGFIEIPSTLQYSKMQFTYDTGSRKVPEMIAWMTEPGLFYGQLDITSEQNTNSIFINGELLNYPNEENTPNIKDPKNTQAPLSFVLTNFHALIMYPNKVKAVCLLNQELIYENSYPESQGTLRAIMKDPTKHTIIAVTDNSVSRYKVVREERNVWQIYCNKQQFDLAKKYCGNNTAYIDKINVKQAELLFSQGDYETSGLVYADTQSSFETICLKFLQAEQIDGLKKYLEKRLEGFAEEDHILISIVVIWMCELYLSQLAELRRKGEEDLDRYGTLQNNFETFLQQPKVRKCMKQVKNAIYDLMTSHGDRENYIKLTILNEDYENVVSEHINCKSYLEALEVLRNQKQPSLYYQFTPTLMQEVPKQTVNALIAMGSKLKPVQLLPAFLSCENDELHTAEIVRYLEFMVQHFNVREQAVHNYLVSLYAASDTDALMRYINRQGQELAQVNYDVHFALRLCHDLGVTAACVRLSALLGQWEAAVELALTLDEAEARAVADRPEDEALRKTLWLKIAEHVISAGQDVGEATRFLEECPLLKIEDILPYFSDVVTIDHFREPICQSLQEYNNQIEDLKMEMEEATKAAEQVRSEIESFRDRSSLVSVTDPCCLCQTPLLLRPFYLFVCGHRFHSDCLRDEIKPLLGSARRTKLEELERELSSLSTAELSEVTWSGETRREQLRADLDDAVAGDCVRCGELTVRALDQPFIPHHDWDRVMKEWE